MVGKENKGWFPKTSEGTVGFRSALRAEGQLARNATVNSLLLSCFPFRSKMDSDKLPAVDEVVEMATGRAMARWLIPLGRAKWLREPIIGMETRKQEKMLADRSKAGFLARP